MSTLRLRIDGRRFRDADNREVILRGINVAGDAKYPAEPEQPSHVATDFFEGDDVSFVGKPFALDEVDTHFARLQRWGYNTIRYTFTWEAIEHAGPGKYDERWIEHTIATLRKAKKYGFYVYMDPHQDVWSRFTGGSGAPMWTIYACGLDPRKFAVTQAALVQNVSPDPAQYPKMIWPTNYTRLACQTIQTLFFGGREFAPKAIIDGVNIQDYLQGHFIGACAHLAKRMKEAGDLENSVVIGWESINEPNRGFLGWQDLSAIPAEQKMKKGTSPTAWQAILLGSGTKQQVDTWEFGNLGPYKAGSEIVDPKGVKCWLTPDAGDEERYGWKRDPGWKLGECLWAQHGVWDPKKGRLLKKDYFARHPDDGQKITLEYYTNKFFLRHYRAYAHAIRSVFPSAVMFCQSSPFELPLQIKGTPDDDPNMVYAAHFYDGITLIMKKWNRLWNVDVLGVMRGRYLAPAFAVKIGETAIRNCFRDQLAAMRQEGLERMGDHPCVFTEIGIPYDMDDRQAYGTGNYQSQTAAMDANHYALEGAHVAGYSVWAYTASNNHKWGDNWNGEDLSIYSVDDKELEAATGQISHEENEIGSAASSVSGYQPEDSLLTASTLHKPTSRTERASNSRSRSRSRSGASAAGESAGLWHRAAEAFVRPTPIVVHGDIVSFGFDLRSCMFNLSLQAGTATSEDTPSEIFLPAYHFPSEDLVVEVTSGKWSLVEDESAPPRRLRWWHGEGEQKLTINGAKSKTAASVDESAGYLDICRESCSVM